MGISRLQALDCLRSDDLIGIGMEADAVRRSLHPDNVVTYRTVCDVDLSAPVAPLSDPALNLRLTCASLDSTGHIAEACAALRHTSPDTWIEVRVDAALAPNPALATSIPRWSEAGARSLSISYAGHVTVPPETFLATLDLHRAAHRLGMRTTVAVPFDRGESPAQRLDMLDAVLALQQQTGGIAAVVPVALDSPGGRELDGTTAVERLRMLALCRILLDTVPHLQSTQVGGGLKVLQTALRFGADDVELRLPQPAITPQTLRHVIRDAGFRPVERDGAFTTMYLD